MSSVQITTRRLSLIGNVQARSQDCQNEEADRSSAPPLPSPPLRSRPLNPARGLGSAVSSASGVWGRAPAEIDLVHFSVKIWHLVATILIIFLRIN